MVRHPQLSAVERASHNFIHYRRDARVRGFAGLQGLLVDQSNEAAAVSSQAHDADLPLVLAFLSGCPEQPQRQREEDAFQARWAPSEKPFPLLDAADVEDPLASFQTNVVGFGSELNWVVMRHPAIMPGARTPSHRQDRALSGMSVQWLGSVNRRALSSVEGPDPTRCRVGQLQRAPCPGRRRL
jgi:hypothetical protein